MLGLRGRAQALPGLQLASLAAGAACLSGWVALSLSGLGAAAVSACADPGAVTGVVKSINTTDGCDTASGNAGMPVTGYISFHGTANTTYSLVDVYQTLPDSSAQNYSGAYVLDLTSLLGTSTNGTYTVAPGASSYPTLPFPMPVGTLATMTTDGSGNADASYGLTLDAAPLDVKIVSSRNDLWVMNGDSELGHVATMSVKPPTITVPTPTPTPVSTPTPTPVSTPTPTPVSTPTPTPVSTPTPTPASTPTPTPESTPTPTPESTPTPTPASTPTPTPASTPTPTPIITIPTPTPTGGVLGNTPSPVPTGGVQGITTTPAPTGGVAGVTTPNTGAGSDSPLATTLLVSGLGLLLAGGLIGRRRHSA